MVTRAQLNAALRDLEERLKRDSDLRLEARFADFRQALEERLAGVEEEPELREEDIRLLIEEITEETRQEGRRSVREICELRARITALEQVVELLSGEAVSSAAEEDGEIRDDFGS